MVMLTSIPAPTDGIEHKQPRTRLFVGDQEFGSGILYITESKVTWINDNGEGISFLYSNIGFNAVCKDIQHYGAECLILWINSVWLDDADGNREEDNDEDVETVLRFAPEDKDQLDAMHRAMTFCQSLHPDPIDSFSEFSEDDYEDTDDETNVWAGGDSENTNRNERPYYEEYREIPTSVRDGENLPKKVVEQQQDELLYSLTNGPVDEIIEEAEERDPTCVICLVNKRNRVAVPCGHVILCKECLPQFVHQVLYGTVISYGRLKKIRLPITCPICRSIIGRVIPIMNLIKTKPPAVEANPAQNQP
ncbi:methylosome subunit pICln-like [Macrosteles quadrilineatus]|uniref:methylosome subunit pICln-like n=1 Tax=Macrosteles quadrilineatus TaxID=74068 RepID=UPI0023E2D969|nr:methylosome subunit pICln-like [Macrosteles quadrilineatus]